MGITVTKFKAYTPCPPPLLNWFPPPDNDIEAVIEFPELKIAVLHVA